MPNPRAPGVGDSRQLMHMKKIILLTLAVALHIRPALAQELPPPLDDDFLNFLVGDWNGTSIPPGRDKPVYDRATIGWGLNHQFLIFREVMPRTGPPQYEMHGYMTYDRVANKYRSFWFDVAGAIHQLEGERQGERIRWEGLTALGKSVCLYTRETPNRFRVSLQVMGQDGKWQSLPDVVRERRMARE